jgi:hypothetical protein
LQGLADVTQPGARKRDQSVATDLAQHLTRDLGTSARTRRQTNA